MTIDALAHQSYQVELRALRQQVADLERALAAQRTPHHSQYAHVTQLEQFFARAADGFFIMELDQPLRWDETTDKEQALDYAFTHQRITKVNDAMLAQYGATREQFIGRTPADFFAHDLAYGRRIWRDFFDTGRLHIDTDERKFDGIPMWIEGDYICLYDAQGRITGHFGVQREVTKRRQIEQTLRTNEHNLWNFFNTIDQLLFVLDEQGRILHANQTVYQRLGYTAEELIGQSVLLVHPPERREEAGHIVAEMLAGRCDYCPVPVQTKDGRLIPVETRVQAGEWSGHPAIFGVTKDLSALKSSEEKFTKVFEVSPTLMAISDLTTGQYIDVNAAFLNTLGFERGDIIGHSAQELNLFVRPDQRTLALQALQQHGYLRNFDVDVRDKAGQLHLGQFAAEFIQLQDRRVLLTVMNDMTERQRVQTALQEQLDFVNTLLETIPNPVFYKDRAGRYTGCNQAFAALLNLTSADIIGKTVFDFTTPDLAAKYHAMDEELYARGQRQTYEWPMVTPAGEQHAMLFDKAPLQDAAGQITGLIGIITDITDRKQMEQALRASEEKFRRVVEESRDALSLSDEDGCIIEWNHSTELLTGISRAEALGQTYWEIQWRLILPQRRSQAVYEALQQQFQTALRTGHAPFMDKPIIAHFQRADGESRIALQHVYPIKTARGFWLGNTSLDITDLKRTEAALNQLNAELEQRVAARTRELIEANLRLTELDRLKDEFISRINHELRTPLTSIKAYIELLSFGKPEKIQKYIQIIGEQGERLHQIIETLLEVPQLRVGEIDVNPEYVEINALVSGLCANRQSVAVLRGIQLQTCLADRLPLVLTDKSLVLRSLLNVVTNALNYTPRSGTVTLSTASHPEADRVWVTITITDTGPGISDKDRPYIFEPFYRGDATNDYKTPGTGVGLFMARRLLDTLGGKITVDSPAGPGATFTLWLPDGAVVHA
ncbi:MAG: PAS domain S-box protein [Thermoflexales bacterium]|nr:PAS domain S-box protein [Thermoflexales bacterium]